MNNEDIPYRSAVPSQSIEVASTRNPDEDHYSTLKSVYGLLEEYIAVLDSWHAFDLKESEMTLKHQIKAHQLAYEILSPLAESVKQAIEAIDIKYREK